MFVIQLLDNMHTILTVYVYYIYTVFPNNVYSTTSDLQCRYFLSSFCFLVFFMVSSGKNRLLTTYCLVIVFGPVKVSSLHDLLSSEILKLLGKTVYS